MKDIREIAPKPSDALQAMVDGLKEQDQREDFEIDMDYFGSVGLGVDNETCFGCAATCALQKIAGKNLDQVSIQYPADRYEVLNLKDCRQLEIVFDHARSGIMTNLFLYYGVNATADLFYPDFCLENYNWREELPKLEAYILLLKSENL